MAFFYIIDKKRNLHLAEGATKSYAIDKFNDNNKIRADHTISAIPCVHPRKFIAPELPEWMDDIQLTIGSSICYKCSADTKQDSAIIEDGFYQSKNEL